jgi:hypothetical protein
MGPPWPDTWAKRMSRPTLEVIMTESPMHLPLKYVEALIIAESEVLLARVRAARCGARECREGTRERAPQEERRCN